MSLQKLPVPADFATRAAATGNIALCAHYGVCRSIVIRWRKQTGVKGKRGGGRVAMPVPSDFAAIAPAMRNEDLAARYGVCRFLITKWRKAAGVPAEVKTRTGPLRRAAPDGFAALASQHGTKWLAGHFRASLRMVRRWYGETGTARLKPAPKAPKPKPRETQPKMDRSRQVTGYRRMPAAKKRTHMVANTLRRDISTEGQAADVLRRFVAVYRCVETGRADPDGTHWRYGNAVLTGPELVARAVRHGFDPDAWRRLPSHPNPQPQGLRLNEGAM